jgi:UDP-sulfoquinovose synthase
MKFNKLCHMVHIGTMGVYGYGAVEGSTIPEGYCKAKLNCDHVEKCECPSAEIVHPYYPGSVYHMTKCLDNVTLLNFHKYFGLKITELHQGIVWGVSTDETEMDPVLVNRVDVDSDYGTVLNRFCAQVANDYPMTIYGTGGQTRGFINIKDSVKCITLAI